jgi:hypothetical protein
VLNRQYVGEYEAVSFDGLANSYGDWLGENLNLDALSTFEARPHSVTQGRTPQEAAEGVRLTPGLS